MIFAYGDVPRIACPERTLAEVTKAGEIHLVATTGISPLWSGTTLDDVAAEIESPRPASSPTPTAP